MSLKEGLPSGEKGVDVFLSDLLLGIKMADFISKIIFLKKRLDDLIEVK